MLESPKRREDLEKVIKKAVKTFHEHNLSQFTKDRSLSVGASEVFKCIRQTGITKAKLKEYKKLQKPMPIVDGHGYMLRGTIMEDKFIVPVISEAFKDDPSLEKLYGEQETVTAPDCQWLTATPDGLAEDYQLEFKTADPRKSIKQGPDPNHVLQTHVQMGIFGRKKTYLIYFNASDWADVTVYEITFRPEVYEKAKQRAEQIMTTPWTKLFKEGSITGDCQYCNYRIECDQERIILSVDSSADKIDDRIEDQGKK